MHYDAVAGEEIGFGIMERSENSIMNALHPRLVELSRADNALDLPRLMAFNEGPLLLLRTAKRGWTHF